MKIVINSCYGGFGLSENAFAEYCKRKNLDPNETGEWDIPRDDSDLIDIVETMGLEESSGDFASLKIVEIPDDVDWYIEEYDGIEWVAERHMTWR